MSDVDAGESIGREAAALSARPRDLDAWWRLSRALASAGRDDASRDATSELGRAASELGAVALAVACARALRDAGAERDASALVDRIATTHCRGSKRIDPSLRKQPPGPPPADAPDPTDPPTELDAATSLASAAIAAAAKDARERRAARLAPTPLVGVLEPAQLGDLIGVMTLVERARGDVILDVGQPATALHWLARGGAEVSRGDRLLGELRAGAFFGEIALVGGTTRTARVACLEDTTTLEVPADAVEKLAERAPKLARVLAGYARTRLLANVMRTSAIFARLSPEERRDLAPRFRARMVERGDTILARGEENEHLFVVASGAFEVREDGEVVARLAVGDGVGEMSMLGRKPAMHDVVATEPSVVLHLSRDDFDRLAVAHPGLLAEVYKLLVERERENDALVHDADDLIL